MHKAWSGIEQVPFCFSRSSVKGHADRKVDDLVPTLAFPRDNANLATKSHTHTHLLGAWKRYPKIFPSHPTNFKVTRFEKSMICHRFERVRAMTRIWMRGWLWNDTHCFQEHGWYSALFFKVIRQISKSHGPKIDDLGPIWARLIGRSQLWNPSDLPCFTPSKY